MIWKLLPPLFLLIFLALGQYGAEHHHLWLVILAIPFWFAAAVAVFVSAVKEPK